MSDYSLAQFRAKSEVLQDMGLTPGHMKVLMSLEPGSSRPMGSCADRVGCDASTATWLIDRLEERGLVERRPLKSDRRVKAVALTPEGETTRGQLMDHLYDPPPALIGMEPAELQSLIGVMERLCAKAEGTRGSGTSR